MLILNLCWNEESIKAMQEFPSVHLVGCGECLLHSLWMLLHQLGKTDSFTTSSISTTQLNKKRGWHTHFSNHAISFCSYHSFSIEPIRAIPECSMCSVLWHDSCTTCTKGIITLKQWQKWITVCLHIVPNYLLTNTLKCGCRTFTPTPICIKVCVCVRTPPMEFYVWTDDFK